MKRLLLLLQLLIVFNINAQFYKYASTNLSLRIGPSTSYKVQTTIPIGTSVEMAESCDCDWIKVNYNGNIGYVRSLYLTSQKVTTSTGENTTIYLQNSNSSVKYYTNSAGQRVQSPTYNNKVPVGATALCRDGTYNFSRNRRGTCSHHGGVAKWLN